MADFHPSNEPILKLQGTESTNICVKGVPRTVKTVRKRWLGNKVFVTSLRAISGYMYTLHGRCYVFNNEGINLQGFIIKRKKEGVIKPFHITL